MTLILETSPPDDVDPTWLRWLMIVQSALLAHVGYGIPGTAPLRVPAAQTNRRP